MHGDEFIQTLFILIMYCLACDSSGSNENETSGNETKNTTILINVELMASNETISNSWNQLMREKIN